MHGSKSDRFSQMPREQQAYTLESLLGHLADRRSQDRFYKLLTDPGFMSEKLERYGPEPLIRDFDIYPEDPNGQNLHADTLKLLQQAIRISSSILNKDPSQLTPQLVGRLAAHRDREMVAGLIDAFAQSAQGPWLRPLRCFLNTPGGSLVRRMNARLPSQISCNRSFTLALSVNATASSIDDSGLPEDTCVLWDIEAARQLLTYEIPSVFHHSKLQMRVSSNFTTVAFNRAAESLIHIYDIESGRCQHRLEGHSGKVHDFQVSPDGQMAISVGEDKILKMWDLHDGAVLWSLPNCLAYGLQVSQDWKMLFVDLGSTFGFFELWDLERVEKTNILEAGIGNYTARVAMSPDGRRAVSHNGYDKLTLWDLEKGSVLREHEIPDDYGCNCVAVSEQGRWAASASFKEFDAGGKLNLWSLETGEWVYSISAHSDQITKLIISEQAGLFVSSSLDRTLGVWDLSTGSQIETLKGHFGGVLDFDLNVDQGRILSAATDDTLVLWTLEARGAVEDQRHSSEVTGIGVSMDGRTVVSASGERDTHQGELRVWNGFSGAPHLVIPCHSVAALAVTPDGRKAVSGSYDCTLQVWDLVTGICQATLVGHKDEVEDVCISADGSRIGSVAADGTVRIWDAISMCEALLLRGTACDLGQDGKGDGYSVEVASDDNSGSDDEREACSMDLSADGRIAILGFNDGTLELIEVDTCRSLRGWDGHDGFVTAVAISTDAKNLISASDDGTLKYWDLRTGEELQCFNAEVGYFDDVSFSPQGERAASASNQGLALWDLENGTLICEFICDSGVSSCAFLNENRLAAGDAQGLVHLLILEGLDRACE